MSRIRQHLGLFRGRRSARPWSPLIPSDPEDSDFPADETEPESSDASLLPEPEFETEEWKEGTATLREMHHYKDHAVESEPEEEAEYAPPNNPSPTPAPADLRGQLRVETPSVDILRAMKYGRTRYPHEDAMHSLGIHEDVYAIFQAMGLAGFMSTIQPTYPDETAQFLATIRMTPTPGTAATRKYGGGMLTFKINGQRYKHSLHDVQATFNFPDGLPVAPRFDEEELLRVWRHLTGSATLTAARAKGSKVRNPAFNYARRAVAETFFAKDKTGPMTLKELSYLCTALKTLKGTFPKGEPIVGDTTGSGLAYRWVSHVISFKDKLITTYDGINAKTLHLGGPVAAFLKYCGVPLNEDERIEPRFMDEEYLRQAQFLDRRMLNDNAVYKFTHKDKPDALIVLPNSTFTSIDSYKGIRFNPPLNVLVNQDDLVAPPKKKKTKTRAPVAPPTPDAGPSSPTPIAPVEAPPSPVNSDEYEEAPGTYAPYDARRASKHIKASHERTDLLHHPVKWAVKKVKKLLRSFKDDKEEREQRWMAEKAEMERRWSEERVALQRSWEEQQRTLFASSSARYPGEYSHNIHQGRHSTYEEPTNQGYTPMDTSPIQQQPRRHSVSVERSHQREVTPVSISHDVQMGEGSPPPRRRLQRVRQAENRQTSTSHTRRHDRYATQEHGVIHISEDHNDYSRERVADAVARICNPHVSHN